MQHEWITPLTLKRIDNLCITRRSERYSTNGLGLATREQ